MRYYKIDKGRSYFLEKLCYDKCFYIDMKKDSLGRVYYLKVEDFGELGMDRYKMRGDTVRAWIDMGLYMPIDKINLFNLLKRLGV